MNTINIEFTAPSGQSYGLKIPAQKLPELIPHDFLGDDSAPEPFTAMLPFEVTAGDEKFIPVAMACSIAVAQMEQRYNSRLSDEAKAVAREDSSAAAIVDHEIEYIPDDPTPDYLAADFAGYCQMMSKLIRPAMTEFRNKLDGTGISPEDAFMVNGHHAYPLIEAARGEGYARHASMYINYTAMNWVRHYLMYSKLRQQGHTPNEIVEAMVKEAVIF